MSDSSLSQAKAQVESIVEMVAALNCDYDRLSELQEERQALDALIEDLAGGLVDAVSDPDSGAKLNHLKSELDEAKEERKEWEENYLEELNELLDAAGECENTEDAERRIDEDPLSVRVRSGWVSNPSEMEAKEFEILLCTGGPAVRIVGDLDRGQPENPRIEHQDWFEPWTRFTDTTQEQDEAILSYCQHFYFGD